MVVKVPKKKPVKVAEDTKSKKEHINVVFIGHVGKQNKLIINHFLSNLLNLIILINYTF